MRRTGWVPVAAVLTVAILTFGIVRLGPEARPTDPSELLDPSAVAGALTEPADRLALAAWWLAAAVLALAFSWWSRRTPAGPPEAEGARPGASLWVLGPAAVLAVAVTVAALLWGIDPVGIWPGIGFLGLLTGLLASALVMRLWTWPGWAAYAASLVVVGLVLALAMLALAMPALAQTPGSVRDAFHFPFTSDEIAAVAAGRHPLADYIPQYSVLLGFPIAPLVAAWPDWSTWIVLTWLIGLQVVALGVSVFMPVRLGGWRVLAPALVVAVLPPLATSKGLASASTYFAVFPMRVVLPSLTILAAYLYLWNRPRRGQRRWAGAAAIGFLSGLTTLNNPDYGAPAAAAVLITGLLVAVDARRRLAWLAALAVGFALAFVSFDLVSRLLGHPVEWSYWLTFQRAFGAQGVANVPMGSFGLHIAVVALFMSAAVIGFVFVISRRRGADTGLYRQGLLLCLVGGWSLASLAYYTGRSLPPTLVGGFAFQIGMVTAAFLPLLRASLRRLTSAAGSPPLEVAAGLAMGALAIAGAASAIALVKTPSEYVTAIRAAPLTSDFAPLAAQRDLVRGVLQDPQNAQLADLVAAGRVAQFFPMASLTAVGGPMPSAAVVNHPEYLGLSPLIAQAQCRQGWPSGVDHLLVFQPAADALRREPVCEELLDFGGSSTFTNGDSRLVVIPAR